MSGYNANAYWIFPDGEIFPVLKKHIVSVIEDPEKFGLEIEYIRDMYNAFNEPIGFEGKARREIMFVLILSKYIRCRYNYSNRVWTIESCPHQDHRICHFFNFLLKKYCEENDINSIKTIEDLKEFSINEIGIQINIIDENYTNSLRFRALYEFYKQFGIFNIEII